jgi:UDPglucose 6-dehydrogenase
MKAAVIGLGYVGLANAVALSRRGVNVAAYDTDGNKIEALQNKMCPLDDPDLEEAIQKGSRRLSFTSDEKEAYEGAQIYVICVDTPTLPNGESDLTHLLEAAEAVKRHSEGDVYLINRSTVPVGTADRLRESLNAGLKGRVIHVISDPEFLREGSSLYDEENPYRIVLGVRSKESRKMMRKLYSKAIRAGVPYYEMDNASAELAKYASNAFLATKISFINELSRYSDKVGTDISQVALAIGADPRIGHSMLNVSPGYGGQCFPKDVSALTKAAESQDASLTILEAAKESNDRQIPYLLGKSEKAVGGFEGKTIAVLGLSFKGSAGDARNGAALKVIPELIKRGASVKAFDPSEKARDGFMNLYGGGADIIAPSLEECVKGADAILILTDNRAFKDLDEMRLLGLMKGRLIIDWRNLYPLGRWLYFRYVSVGRPDSLPVAVSNIQADK